MRRYYIICLIALLITSCNTGTCDKGVFTEQLDLEVLKEAELEECFEKGGSKQGIFQLSKRQVRDMLDAYNFEPVRKSITQFRSPIRRLNRIVEEIDQLSTFEPKMEDGSRCILIIKENTAELIVILTDKDLLGI